MNIVAGLLEIDFILSYVKLPLIWIGAYNWEW